MSFYKSLLYKDFSDLTILYFNPISDKINVVKTYRDGNKGSKPMTPKQVALRVQAKAHELGDLKPANYMNLII
ncbi:MAG: hypothetical protein RLZZ86_1874 [Cyanobacteriota bacterium]